MNLKQQFNGTASYVSPSCKSVELKTRGDVLVVASYGDPGAAGRYGGWIEEDEDY